MIITDTNTHETFTNTGDLIASFTHAPTEVIEAANQLANHLDSWEAGAILDHEAQELASYLGLTIG